MRYVLIIVCWKNEREEIIWNNFWQSYSSNSNVWMEEGKEKQQKIYTWINSLINITISKQKEKERKRENPVIFISKNNNLFATSTSQLNMKKRVMTITTTTTKRSKYFTKR